MREAGSHAIDLEHFIVFLVFEVGQPFDNDIDGMPILTAGKILKTPRGLSADEVRERSLVIDRVIGGVGQHLLLLCGLGRRGLGNGAAPGGCGCQDNNGKAGQS